MLEYSAISRQLHGDGVCLCKYETHCIIEKLLSLKTRESYATWVVYSIVLYLLTINWYREIVLVLRNWMTNELHSAKQLLIPVMFLASFTARLKLFLQNWSCLWTHHKGCYNRPFGRHTHQLTKWPEAQRLRCCTNIPKWSDQCVFFHLLLQDLTHYYIHTHITTGFYWRSNNPRN